MRRRGRRQRLGQELGQGIGVGEDPDLAGEPAREGAEILPQPLGLRKESAGMLEERAAGGGRHHALPGPQQERRAKGLLHVANAGEAAARARCARAGPVRDAAGVGDMAKEVQIGQVEEHGTLRYSRRRRFHANYGVASPHRLTKSMFRR